MGKSHAVRSDHWRYVRLRDGTEQLHDLATDPHEWTDLAEAPEHAAVKQELARWMPAQEEVRQPGRRRR